MTQSRTAGVEMPKFQKVPAKYRVRVWLLGGAAGAVFSLGMFAAVAMMGEEDPDATVQVTKVKSLILNAATPVPEPAAWGWITAGGLAGWTLLRRRFAKK
jgi:hypothetical protein